MVDEFGTDRFCSRCGGLHIRNAEEVIEFTNAYREQPIEACFCKECGCAEVQEALYVLAVRMFETPNDPTAAQSRAIKDVLGMRARKSN